MHLLSLLLFFKRSKLVDPPFRTYFSAGSASVCGAEVRKVVRKCPPLLLTAQFQKFNNLLQMAFKVQILLGIPHFILCQLLVEIEIKS